MKKLLSQIVLILQFLLLIPMNSIAMSNVNVYIGDHGFTNGTNMVIEFTLGVSILAGNNGEINIFFDADDDHTTGEGILTNIDTSGLGDSIYLYNVTDNVLHEMTTGVSSGTTFGYAISTAKDILNMTWNAGVADDFTSGDVIQVYLGDSDNDGTGGISGVYDKTVTPLVDGNANENLTNPAQATGYDHVDVDIEVDYKSNGVDDSSSGAYALTDFASVAGADVLLDAANDPYLRMSLSQTAIDFGDFSVDSVSSDTSLTVDISTNAQTGYTLRYRASDFVNQDVSPHTLTALTQSFLSNGTEGWGLNFIANTGTSGGTVGVLGTAVNVISGNYLVDPIYGTDDKFSVKTDGTFATIATSGDVSQPVLNPLGPGQAVYTMSAVASVATNTPLGDYSTSLTFNAYANF